MITYIDDPKPITVALPLFNAGKIFWLAMEGLARQETNQEWELVICQENPLINPGYVVREDIFLWYDKLRAAGCRKILNIEIDEKIPLYRKWQFIGKSADRGSKVFMLHAADCYSNKERIENTYQKIVGENYDWYDVNSGYFFDFASGGLIEYHDDGRAVTNLNMAFKTCYARNIPETTLTSGIDGFLFRHCKESNKEFRKFTDMTLYSSLDTHGCNNISKGRGRHFTGNPQWPFIATSRTITDMGLPREVVEKLKAVKIGQ